MSPARIVTIKKAAEAKKPIPLRSFFPVFVIVLILPFIWGLIGKGDALSLVSRANRVPQLRIWIEPKTVILNQGETARLSIVGDYDGNLVGGVSGSLEVDGDVQINPPDFRHAQVWRGRVVLAQVEVRGGDQSSKLSIDRSSIKTNGDINLDIETVGADILVKP